MYRHFSLTLFSLKYYTYRCHRIGQQAKVRCLYIIAKGTLDEVLFLLLQKKFRDLGEFVEGKEKMDIVMHNSYSDERRAIESICMPDSSTESNNDECEHDSSFDDSNFKTLAGQDNILHDIEELAREEQAEFKGEEEDDDEPLDVQSSSKINSDAASKRGGNGETINKIGASEQHAICLCDEDDDETPFEPESVKDILSHFSTHNQSQFKIHNTTKIPNTKLYYMYFDAPTYNFMVERVQGRLVIVRGENVTNGKCMPGDFILGINNMMFHLHQNNMISTMKKAIHNPPVKLLVGRNADFSNLIIQYRNRIDEEKAKAKKQQQQHKDTSHQDLVQILE